MDRTPYKQQLNHKGQEEAHQRLCWISSNKFRKIMHDEQGFLQILLQRLHL